MRQLVRGERVKLPGVNRVRRRGALYRYHRKTGARLPDLPEDHPAFVAAWAAEEAKGAPRAPRHDTGTIGAAVAAYLASDKYLALSPNYRRVIRRHVDQIATAYGAGRIADLRADHIATDLDRMTANPARARRKAWRCLCGFAKATGLAPTDPSAATVAPKAPKTQGRKPLTRDDIAAVRARWPVEHPRRLAFELILWTGCRISDAVRLGPQMVSGGDLVFLQEKTGGEASIPMTGPLADFADPETFDCLMTCLAAQPPEMLYIRTQTGKPRTVGGLGNWMAETIRLAGVTGKSAHGLRKSRLIDLAERGAGVMAMMAWGGHETMAEVQHYIEAAERRRSIRGTEQDRNTAKHPDPSAKLAKK